MLGLRLRLIRVAGRAGRCPVPGAVKAPPATRPQPSLPGWGRARVVVGASLGVREVMVGVSFGVGVRFGFWFAFGFGFGFGFGLGLGLGLGLGRQPRATPLVKPRMPAPAT